jgi:two-component system sensor histidine kinase RegB
VGNATLFVGLLLDVAALTAQLHLSGGAGNPFISLFLLQVILGAVLLRPWSVWALVAITTCCFLVLTAFHRPLLLPHDHGDPFALHVQGMFLSFLLAAILLVLFITRINANLHARDEHLARLRQQSAEEDLIVRMGLLASGAAHELGTPLSTLSVILGDWARLPAFRGDAELAADLADMQQQLARCKAIVSSILRSAGAARGEGTLRTSLAAFIGNTVGEWRDSRSPTRFDYAGGALPDLPIVADEALKQVLFNVLDNALEASPAWVGFSATPQNGALMIEVRDAGPGFDPDILGSIGRPYRSTRERAGGGLGMFLVVNVLRKLGGTVTARNLGAGGAAVVLTLPLAALRPDSAGG